MTYAQLIDGLFRTAQKIRRDHDKKGKWGLNCEWADDKVPIKKKDVDMIEFAARFIRTYCEAGDGVSYLGDDCGFEDAW